MGKLKYNSYIGHKTIEIVQTSIGSLFVDNYKSISDYRINDYNGQNKDTFQENLVKIQKTVTIIHMHLSVSTLWFLYNSGGHIHFLPKFIFNFPSLSIYLYFHIYPKK